ncbi:hypothetical protein HL653_08945 [Sphingomonas sp. AP4-R1]|uniref:hypothetical protein n=1 Tax=Sphingomonas sp. AP4-R1 TaxID=2735134 RepID=UPI0014933129|nr:hypothetical protein [Sphingomonas sp. AP4-R1]QJU57900.1 hypothetical protein HL653_08945 [Sphingomonas sp. AP4-R1]
MMVVAKASQHKKSPLMRLKIYLRRIFARGLLGPSSGRVHEDGIGAGRRLLAATIRAPSLRGIAYPAEIRPYIGAMADLFAHARLPDDAVVGLPPFTGVDRPSSLSLRLAVIQALSRGDAALGFGVGGRRSGIPDQVRGDGMTRSRVRLFERSECRSDLVASMQRSGRVSDRRSRCGSLTDFGK